MTTNTLARPDTLLGICEALGEDLGINPLPLRIALTAGMLWSPLAMIGLYLAAGVMIAVIRALTCTSAVVAAAPAVPVGHNDDLAPPTALAA